MRGARALRPALLLTLVAGLVFGIPALALADHDTGHNHPFCGQGGLLVQAGQGGTDVDDVASFIEARRHFADVAPAEADNRPILVPQHLADRLTTDPVEDPDGDGFVQIEAPLEVAATGTDASQFHGGHGGGPGGGQGGETFHSAGGDGGCNNAIQPITNRPPGRFIPGRRLPITGPSTQFLIMGGAFLALGLGLVFGPKALGMATGGAVTIGAVPASGEVVPRLRDAVKGFSWAP